MGWTFTHRPKGMTSNEFFKQEFGEQFFAHVVATATKNGVFYIVYEASAEREPSLQPDANGKVRFAFAIRTKRAKDQYNFGYKEQDEFMGPYGVSAMPTRLLKLLSPFRLEAAFASAKYSPQLRWAARWRNECQANAGA